LQVAAGGTFGCGISRDFDFVGFGHHRGRRFFSVRLWYNLSAQEIAKGLTREGVVLGLGEARGIRWEILVEVCGAN